MKRRYHLPPPANAKYVVVKPVEVSAESDKLNAGKLAPLNVRLTPVGPNLNVVDVPPEDESAARTRRAAFRRAAFLDELENSASVWDGERERKGELSIRRWGDVIPDSTVWPALTAFLVKVSGQSYASNAFRFGGAPLATYWLTASDSRLRQAAVTWLSENWKHEWDRLPDSAKRAVVDELAGRLARLEGTNNLVLRLAETWENAQRRKPE